MNITIALAGNPNSGKDHAVQRADRLQPVCGQLGGRDRGAQGGPCFELADDQRHAGGSAGRVFPLALIPSRRTSPATSSPSISPDVVLNIVDATNLERNLYLTLQLMELERPVVVALNMIDELKRRGDNHRLRARCPSMLETRRWCPSPPKSAGRASTRCSAAIHEQAHHPQIAYPARRSGTNPPPGTQLRQIVEALGGLTAPQRPSMYRRAPRPSRRGRARRRPCPPAPSHAHIGGYDGRGRRGLRPAHHVGGAEAAGGRRAAHVPDGAACPTGSARAHPPALWTNTSPAAR